MWVHNRTTVSHCHLKCVFAGTQVDQDHLDEEARHQARESLIQSWKDRLSAMSLIVCLLPPATCIPDVDPTCDIQTTFFVATEAQLLSGAVSGGGSPSKLGNATNAGLTGALVIHSFAGRRSTYQEHPPLGRSADTNEKQQ